MSAAKASAVSTPSTTSVTQPIFVKPSIHAASSMPPNTAITPGMPGNTVPSTPMKMRPIATIQSRVGSIGPV
jgi:hypothetical protein